MHVFYDRFVMAEPFAAAINSPVQWVFDRTAAAGVQRGQYLAISLSAAQEWQERKAAEIEKIFVAELARLLPRADPGHVERVLVTREPHATFAQLPGPAGAPAGQRDGVARAGRRRRVDPYRLARDHGKCGAKRPGGRPCVVGGMKPAS